MSASMFLRTARQTAGLSQRALAARAGTSQAAVAAYEAGRKDPATATLARLLDACGARLQVVRNEPSDPDLVATGRTLVEVLELAAALPVRHAARSGFPRLPGPPNKT